MHVFFVTGIYNTSSLFIMIQTIQRFIRYANCSAILILYTIIIIFFLKNNAFNAMIAVLIAQLTKVLQTALHATQQAYCIQYFSHMNFNQAMGYVKLSVMKAISKFLMLLFINVKVRSFEIFFFLFLKKLFIY